MRALVLSHELPPVGGGGGRIALELARRLADLGHEIEVIAPALGDAAGSEIEGSLTLRRLACGRRHIEYSTNLEKLRWVHAALGLARAERRRFDLLHCHFILPAGMIARIAAPELPYLITCHGSDVPGHNPYESGLEHRVLRPVWQGVVAHASAVVSPSENLRQLLLEQAPGMEPRLHRIPNGYPAGRFQPAAERSGVLMVSRFIELKGFQFFLEGLADVDLEVPVHLVGDGPMRAELETLAASTPTEIIFHGWLDNQSDELRRLFESCALFVFPSVAENFPTVLLEAMDAGMAIVTTDVEGCPEVVGEAGVTVPPRDPQALVTATEALLADPARAQALGEQARRRVLTEFDWGVIERRYEALYEQVSNGRR